MMVNIEHKKPLQKEESKNAIESIRRDWNMDRRF